MSALSLSSTPRTNKTTNKHSTGCPENQMTHRTLICFSAGHGTRDLYMPCESSPISHVPGSNTFYVDSIKWSNPFLRHQIKAQPLSHFQFFSFFLLKISVSLHRKTCVTSFLSNWQAPYPEASFLCQLAFSVSHMVSGMAYSLFCKISNL